MRNKENSNIYKKKSEGLFNSSKIIKDVYDARYDLSQLQILTVDGVLPFLDSEESRLLFFHNIPSVAINNDKEEKSLNKCLVEIRMTTPTLRMISSIINYELEYYEKNQHDDRKCELKTKNYEHYMFGWLTVIGGDVDMNYKNIKDVIIDIETTGKYPWDGKIVCIGCKNCDDFETKIFFDRDEEKLLMEFLKYFNKCEFNRIVGYNVAHDYRFLTSKCIKYRIALKDFQFVKLIDVMKILKEAYHGYNYNQAGTLDEWAKFLVGRGKLLKNRSIKDLLSENRDEEIVEYNTTDVELTYKIYERINQVMVVR